jgi:hypothetical protein
VCSKLAPMTLEIVDSALQSDNTKAKYEGTEYFMRSMRESDLGIDVMH